jgi:hypothetical protein
VNRSVRLAVIVFCLLMVAPFVAWASAATPESVRQYVDGLAIVLMLAWGVVHKFAPRLSGLSNSLIPWVNAIAYALVKILTPPAAVASVGGAVAGRPLIGTG